MLFFFFLVPDKNVLVCSLFDACYDRDVSVTFHLFGFPNYGIGVPQPTSALIRRNIVLFSETDRPVYYIVRCC